MSSPMDVTVHNLCIKATGRSRAPGRTILPRTNLHVRPGESLAIMGPSGAGKSTLIKAMLGEISQGLHLSSGTITIAGMNPLALSARALRAFRRTCAYVDQDPGAALPPHWSVTRIIQQRANLTDTEKLALLDEVGLSDLTSILDRTPAELSGGQRRRLGVAVGIAAKPRLLLIDEPTAGIDKAATRALIDTVQVARSRSQPTTIVVTHDLDVAKQLADRVLILGETQPAHPAPQERMSDTTKFAYPPDNQVILDINDLSLNHGREEILRNFSLQVSRGEIVGIAGPSGRGKTTILRAIMGLHPILSGTIRVAEPDAIGWIPQESALSLNPAVPVAAILRRAAPNDTHIRAMLDRLYLPDFLASPARLKDTHHHRFTRPDDLSGGQRQRVSIARALLTQPNLLLADEPTSALDRVNTQRVMSVLRDDSANRATLLVSHEQQVLRACDRVILI